MKKILLIATAAILVGCTQTAYITKPKQTDDVKLKREGKVEFIHYKTGKTSSTLLAERSYKGKRAATKKVYSMHPQVLLADAYIEISYPAKTKIPKRVIPREALIELEWAK